MVRARWAGRLETTINSSPLLMHFAAKLNHVASPKLLPPNRASKFSFAAKRNKVLRFCVFPSCVDTSWFEPPRVCRRLQSKYGWMEPMEKSNRANRFSTEVRARAVRMIFEHEHEYANQSAAIMAIAPKIGCGRDTLRRWVKQSDFDSGR